MLLICEDAGTHCYHLGVAMILYLRGTLAKELYSGLRSTLSGPPGQLKVKCCKRVTTKRNISMRARDSPTQARFPERKSTRDVRVGHHKHTTVQKELNRGR